MYEQGLEFVYFAVETIVFYSHKHVHVCVTFFLNAITRNAILTDTARSAYEMVFVILLPY